jgi:hypothetical protein
MNYLDIARKALAQAAASTQPPPSLPADPSLLSALLPLSLEAFEQTGMTLEIRVPFLDVTLFFCSSSHLTVLLAQGISRGRIWTTSELEDVLQLPPDHVPTIAIAKALYGGDVIAVRPREISEESERRS